MIRSHKIRLNPTPEQAQYFRQAAGVARFTYNWALGQWKDAYARGETVSARALKKQFNAIKRTAFPWVLEVTKCAPEQAFTDLGTAFANFFRDIKRGKKRGFPRFKSKKRSTPSFYLANDKFAVDGYWIRIPKLGQVSMTEALRFNGKILSARVTERAGWWFVSIVVELSDVLHERDDSVVGVDVGITTLATLSDGTVFENQKHLAQALKRVRGLSRSFSRKTKGSRSQAKAAHKLARAHYQVACRRADSQHKATTHIARTYTYVGIEDLNVAGMVKNRKLARALSDAALGQFCGSCPIRCLHSQGHSARLGGSMRRAGCATPVGQKTNR